MTETEQQILQRRMAQFLVGEVFNTISEQDVLSASNGQWMHKGAPLTDGMRSVLKREAEMLSNTKLYPILLAELRYHGRMALDKAETEADIITAKLLSYFVDVIQSKVKKIAEL